MHQIVLRHGDKFINDEECKIALCKLKNSLMQSTSFHEKNESASQRLNRANESMEISQGFLSSNVENESLR